MKLHRHLVEQLIAALLETFSGHRPADKVIERILKTQRKWGSRDRRFFAETCYDIVRHWRRLWVQAGLEPARYLDADHLDAGDVWAVWARHEFERTGEIPDWPELRGLSFERGDVSRLPRAVRESIPDWMDELGSRDFGAEWDGVIAALNKPADVYLRTNTLKAPREVVLDRLVKEDVACEAVPGLPLAIRLPVRKNVFITQAFRDGLFEVQDAASQTVAALLDPQPGERVVDACAGAGGKSLHIAALMKNKGRLLSMDIHEWKLGELRERARRAGVSCIEPRVIESTKTIKRLEASFDRVLLDVPCSGMGVLRRNPDSKWRLSPDEIARLRVLQSDILRAYSRMAKPGGVLVYATCSLLPEENSRQVQVFLASDAGQNWTLEKEENHRPDREGFDGFYAARLRRG